MFIPPPRLPQINFWDLFQATVANIIIFLVQSEENRAVKECKAVDLHCFTTWAKGKYAVVSWPVKESHRFLTHTTQVSQPFLHFFKHCFCLWYRRIIFRVLNMPCWCIDAVLFCQCWKLARFYRVDLTMRGDACRSILGASIDGSHFKKVKIYFATCVHIHFSTLKLTLKSVFVTNAGFLSLFFQAVLLTS